jgi:hypothetical protein
MKAYVSPKSDLPLPEKDKGKRWAKRQGVGPKKKKKTGMPKS